ncbi:hypothetical protein [Brevundimonas sp.]
MSGQMLADEMGVSLRTLIATSPACKLSGRRSRGRRGSAMC